MIDSTLGEHRPQAPLATTPFHRYTLPDGTVWTEFHRTEAGYLLRFPGLADFHVSSDGRAVFAFPVPGVDPFTIEHLAINQVQPLALSRQGKPAFHGSAIAVPGGAIAFLGMSGMGKSTLAAFFARAGHGFLTDDGLLVEETLHGPFALPNHPSIRLWEDSLENLLDADAPRGAPVSYTSKIRLLASDSLPYCDTPQRLLAAYVMESGDTPVPKIAPLVGMNRVMGWLHHAFLLDIEDRDLLARHFDWTHRISSAVPTFSLDYPREFSRLPDVRAALLAYGNQLDT